MHRHAAAPAQLLLERIHQVRACQHCLVGRVTESTLFTYMDWDANGRNVGKEGRLFWVYAV